MTDIKDINQEEQKVKDGDFARNIAEGLDTPKDDGYSTDEVQFENI